MIPNLEIKGTRDTPEIIFDKENNLFEIKGNSLPEDTTKFFSPLFEWISEYIKSPNKSTHLICKLEYFNSSSAKMFYEVFLEFQKIAKTGNEIKISWYFEPGDKLIEEKGLEFQSILDIPFELKEAK
ncbi:MAG: DUF1987 domain-containing protein [Bacteroidales bacterium]|nr:DUF1987 domain-containing protein [Bacteroidales bacterium]